MNIVAIISQRLIMTHDGMRAPAFEILIGTPLVKDFIKRNEISALKEVMQKSEHLGMQTFNQSLLSLHREKLIDYEVALAYSSSPDEFRLLAEGITSGTKTLFEDIDYQA